MKKVLFITIAAAMLFSLSACGSEKDADLSETSSGAVSAETEEESSAEVTEPENTSVSSDEKISETDSDSEINADEIFFSSAGSVVWYSIDNGTLTEHTENTVPDIMGTSIIDKLVEEGVIFEGVGAKSFEKIVVTDGVTANSEGLYDIWHTEGILDMSTGFTDLLNNEDADTQRLYLEAISESYKKTYGLDIIDIKCDGMPVITDEINYNDTVEEERMKFAVDDTDIPEVEECYIEFDDE